MKRWNSLVILSTTLLAIFTIMLSGCNNSESAVSEANDQVEIKDIDVTSNVQRGLLENERLSRLDVTVVTLKGDVLLTGLVDNKNQINDVSKLVRDIEGVHTIHNHLAIQNE